MSHRPIGIFDSGIGGLTVFREITALLPEEDLIYLGDTARVPYGTKSPSTVTRYALQNMKFLLEQEVKLVVVACNTASAFALETLHKEFPVPILGVIEPGVLGALRDLASKTSKRVSVIGTEGTIASQAYTRYLLQKDPAVSVSGVACPLFVPLVEEGWWESEVTEQIARLYLKESLARGIDALILGCTHYPLLKKTLRKVIGEDVLLIDSAQETAHEAKLLLEKNGLVRKSLGRKPNDSPMRKFFVTDSPERFERVGKLILGRPLTNVQHVEI